MSKVVSIATAWGSEYGGINSFNHGICSGLADVLAAEDGIVCVVPQADEPQREDAQLQGVRLVVVPRADGTEPAVQANTIVNALTAEGITDIAWWIGHDVITGRDAVEAARLTNGSKSAVIAHMDYGAYMSYKYPARESAVRMIDQIDVWTSADQLLAVGPRLAKVAARAKGTPDDYETRMLIPGIAVEPRRQPLRFSAMAFGRFAKEDDPIKQWSLAVAGFGRAYRRFRSFLDDDPSLFLAGVPVEERDATVEELGRLAQSEAERMVNLDVISYMRDRQQLLRILSRQSLCLMLSLHEGFGLVGWEAIASGVPLVVSRNSGLYELLSTELCGIGGSLVWPVDIQGSYDNVYSNQDVEAVVSAIEQIAANPKQADAKASMLRDVLVVHKRYTWPYTALSLAEKLDLRVSADTAVMKLSSVSSPLLLALAESAEVVAEVANQRVDHFAAIWERLENNEVVTRTLMLFGGISSALCNEEAALRYCMWLEREPEAHFFVCYETGESALLRAATLDSESLSETEGLPIDPADRMREKERRILVLRELMECALNGSAQGVLDRLHFVPIDAPLTAYVMIVDEDIYYSPLSEKRSSLAVSMKLKTNRNAFRRQVVQSIHHAASLAEDDPERDEERESLEYFLEQMLDDEEER